MWADAASDYEAGTDLGDSQGKLCCSSPLSDQAKQRQAQVCRVQSHVFLSIVGLVRCTRTVVVS
jgi:hypothetical protein